VTCGRTEAASGSGRAKVYHSRSGKSPRLQQEDKYKMSSYSTSPTDKRPSSSPFRPPQFTSPFDGRPLSALDTSQQQALFQAYFHAVRTGQIPMPNVGSSKDGGSNGHARTISDAKRGVTYVGQDQLKRLPIPPLDDTCDRYLESVKPFLVLFYSEPSSD
jgi:hypothetical protein